MLKNLKKEWLGNARADLLAGIVVCMALIPEAIGFSIVAGVDPMVGVFASFMISVITAIFGGRTGLISAAAGATALVLASLVQTHGIEYLFAATVLTGIIQIILGICKIGNLMKFIPKPVMIGFVNALGILMFQSQIQHFQGSYILIVLGLIGIAIIYGLPKLTKAVPSPIFAIIILSLIVWIFKIDIKTLGDMGEISGSFVAFHFPQVPFNSETLSIIFPYALSVALVGIVESLLTAQLVDEMTDTPSNKNRECIGQGLANIGAGVFGGIAGCGMIGQTITNQTYGGRGRLSTFLAGVFMLGSIILLNRFVVQIPVIALASVMVVISFSTFNWKSLKRIKTVPITDTLVMLCTVAVVLFTHNLAFGVVAGTILSSLFFAGKMASVHVHKCDESEHATYKISGQLFFASTTSFIESFDYNIDSKRVDLHFHKAKIWDESAVDAIDKVISKYRKNEIKANIIGLSNTCAELVDKISTHKEHVKS